MPGPARRRPQIIEIAGHRPRPVRRHDAGRHGRRRRPRRPRAERARRRPGHAARPTCSDRGRRSIGVDLKHPDGVEAVLPLVEQADGLIEGFRPGVIERLGLGPDACLARNPRLVYGRMTGWGQDGPYAPTAGHDINYIALAGALEPIGRRGQARRCRRSTWSATSAAAACSWPSASCCGLLEAQRTGEGQVVDAAMVDGAAMLMTMFHAFTAMGIWDDERGTNLLDTGAHFYDVYETADGKYVSIGSIEPQFYAELLRLTGLDGRGAALADGQDAVAGA